MQREREGDIAVVMGWYHDDGLSGNDGQSWAVGYGWVLGIRLGVRIIQMQQDQDRLIEKASSTRGP